MRAYDIRWLVLEQDAIVPALEPVLTGELRPAWLSHRSPSYRRPRARQWPPRAARHHSAPRLRRARCSPSASIQPTNGARHERRHRKGTRRRSPVERRRVAHRTVCRSHFSWPVHARLPRSRLGHRADLLPAVRGKCLLRGRGAQPRQRAGPADRRHLELCHAAADPAAARLRAVATAGQLRCRRADGALGSTFGVAQFAGLLLGALLAPMAWLVARDTARRIGLPERRAWFVSIGAGVLAAVMGPFLLSTAVPDSSLTFTVLAVARAC